MNIEYFNNYYRELNSKNNLTSPLNESEGSRDPTLISNKLFDNNTNLSCYLDDYMM